MTHPSDRHLQGYLDGALPPHTREALSEHLQQCAACRDHVAHMARAIAAVRATSPARWSSEGAFWARLAGRLQPTPRACWPMLALVPPLVFVVAGLAVNLLLGLASLIWALVRSGAMAPLAPRLRAALQSIAARLPIRDLLPNWLVDQTQPLAAQALIDWANMAPALQDALLYAAVTTVLGLALVGLVALMLWWAAVRVRPERKEGSVKLWTMAS